MRRELRFDSPLAAPWRISEINGGQVQQSPHHLLLTVPPTPSGVYSDSQISDYASKHEFVWRPPLTMTVRAYLATPVEDMRGTAGFGFWNHPFVPGERGFRLPQACWFFFGSPPNNMALARGVPGHGWKAATIDARRWQFLALLPTAPFGLPLMRIPALYRLLWPVGQRALGVEEISLDTSLLQSPRTYTLHWRRDSVRFGVDGEPILTTRTAPRGALGFIAWIDNQYAVVTPQGHFGFGLLPTDSPQTLVLEQVTIESTSSG